MVNSEVEFFFFQMELPSKMLDQLAIKSRAKNEEDKIFVMDKYIHEDHLSQPLQTNKKHIKVAATFLNG